MERAARLDGMLPDTPIFIFTEGYEPTFFTSFFTWDPSKINVSINGSLLLLTILEFCLFLHRKTFQMHELFFRMEINPNYYALGHPKIINNLQV